jgi:hypothetical protein
MLPKKDSIYLFKCVIFTQERAELNDQITLISKNINNLDDNNRLLWILNNGNSIILKVLCQYMIKTGFKQYIYFFLFFPLYSIKIQTHWMLCWCLLQIFQINWVSILHQAQVGINFHLVPPLGAFCRCDTCMHLSFTSVDTEMCCPKGKCVCQYFILLTLKKKMSWTQGSWIFF